MLVQIGCKDDAQPTAPTSGKHLKPVSESDSIKIPRYKPQPLSEKALQAITDWITFNELHQAILTIGKTNYTKKIRVERTNFLYFSEEFDKSQWQTKEGDVIADTINAPNGTKTADGFKSTDVNAIHYIFQGYFIKEQDTVTLSASIKKGAANFVYFSNELSDPTEKETIVFNIKEGSVAYIPDGMTAKITPEENGWFRCSAQFKCNQRGRVLIGTCGSATEFFYEGNGTSPDFYIWGAQMERRKEMGSYLPTTNAQNTVEEETAYKPQLNDRQIINSSYQKLYYQVDDIYRRILDVETKTIPEKYNIPYIKSRLIKLKTYTLLLSDALKNNSYLTNQEINDMLDTIYSTYNSILEQINKINDTTLEQHMEEILRRQ